MRRVRRRRRSTRRQPTEAARRLLAELVRMALLRRTGTLLTRQQHAIKVTGQFDDAARRYGR